MKVVQEVDVGAAANEAVFRAEEGNLKLPMEIVLMEKESPSIRKRVLTRKMERKLKAMKRKSKVETKKITRITREPKKLMKILITTSITTLQDPNMKEFKSLLILKFQQPSQRKRERSNQIKTISIRK